MSSSKKGRLILGTSRVHDLGDLDWKKGAAHLVQEEEEFWSRVKARACEEAARIVRQAKEEAGRIRAQARADGLAEGRRAAGQEIEQLKQKMQRDCEAILDALSQERKKILDSQREDILKLNSMVLEKVLQLHLQKNNADILAGFLERGLELLEDKQGLIVWVREADQELVRELLHALEVKYPFLRGWQIRVDPGLEGGGLILENGKSKVDSSVKTRWDAVKRILADLQLAD